MEAFLRIPVVKFGVVASLAVGTVVLAQEAVNEKTISLTAAYTAALTAVEKCRADGFRVSAVVLDRGGNIKAVLRDDGAGLHTVDTARRKAYTSLTFRIPSATFAQRVQTNPGLASITDVIALGGGLPIQSGNEVIGAIGVGGAPSGDADAICAQAGLDKVK